jgi:hypothetical protein
LNKLILPNELLENLIQASNSNAKKTLEINFALVEKTCLDTYHLPVTKLHLGEGLFNFFLRRIESGEKLGLALASMWQSCLPISTSMLKEIASCGSLTASNPTYCTPTISRFLSSAAESFLDFWETSNGSPSIFLLLLSLIDCSIDRLQVGSRTVSS